MSSLSGQNRREGTGNKHFVAEVGKIRQAEYTASQVAAAAERAGGGGGGGNTVVRPVLKTKRELEVQRGRHRSGCIIRLLGL